MDEQLPLSMGADTLQAAFLAVTAAEEHLTTLGQTGHDIDVVDYSTVVHIDGEIIGRVEIQDGSFAAFVPNGNWCGFTVEAMG